MKVLLDVGGPHAGILVTHDRGVFTVLSHGKNDRREVTFEDPYDAAAEMFTQAKTLRLYTRVIDECCRLNPGARRNFADYLASETINDQG